MLITAGRVQAWSRPHAPGRLAPYQFEFRSRKSVGPLEQPSNFCGLR
jgi:hypothetical protein